MKSKIFQKSQKKAKIGQKGQIFQKSLICPKKRPKLAKMRFFGNLAFLEKNWLFLEFFGFFGKICIFWNKLLFVISEATYGLHRSRVHDTK
jgi:hypothetical protein